MVAGPNCHFYASSGRVAGLRQWLGPGSVHLQFVLVANPAPICLSKIDLVAKHAQQSGCSSVVFRYLSPPWGMRSYNERY